MKLSGMRMHNHILARINYVVVMQDGEIKLRRSLAECPSASVRREIADIQYNIPELFVE